MQSDQVHGLGESRLLRVEVSGVSRISSAFSQHPSKCWILHRIPGTENLESTCSQFCWSPGLLGLRLGEWEALGPSPPRCFPRSERGDCSTSLPPPLTSSEPAQATPREFSQSQQKHRTNKAGWTRLLRGKGRAYTGSHERLHFPSKKSFLRRPAHRCPDTVQHLGMSYASTSLGSGGLPAREG